MRKAKFAFEGQMQLSGTNKEQEAVGLGRWFRQRDVGIGTRLAACFVTIIVLMIVSDAVAVWQFRRRHKQSPGAFGIVQKFLA